MISGEPKPLPKVPVALWVPPRKGLVLGPLRGNTKIVPSFSPVSNNATDSIALLDSWNAPLESKVLPTKEPLGKCEHAMLPVGAMAVTTVYGTTLVDVTSIPMVVVTPSITVVVLVSVVVGVMVVYLVETLVEVVVVVVDVTSPISTETVEYEVVKSVETTVVGMMLVSVVPVLKVRVEVVVNGTTDVVVVVVVVSTSISSGMTLVLYSTSVDTYVEVVNDVVVVDVVVVVVVVEGR